MTTRQVAEGLELSIDDNAEVQPRLVGPAGER